MSWNATPSAAAAGSASGARPDRAEHGQHLQPDHRGRPVHVDAEVVEGLVAGHDEVHGHRVHEVLEVAMGDAVAVDGVGEGRDHGLLGEQRRAALGVAGARERHPHPRADLLEAGHHLVGTRGARGVHHVVGHAREAVQRVDGGPLGGGEQPRREEVGAPVGGVEGPAAGVGLAQRGRGDPGRVELARRGLRRRHRRRHAASPTMRCAASLPDTTTVGTPTPGVVPHPASTTFSTPRGRLPDRNGPV